ncbi:MAG: DUF5103 domain-containing protein [Bacteroidia bacterium]|nr:DUF5103 domain-containing protein [Bacteroidia bacterium]MBT8275829.1 DUF5103 domain-containing protein [Bacteroidia bacterium]NNF29918.1 DUF5103 domain-containing protein [Flavobacteriaceae bacterium]NNK53390.1 DUF5103 domain-containing protein [Flavobacteriaceae bacterium]NNM07865.1 DUF5103 domain-containing protein [Flavobacteriaceae bacterium]
MGRLFITIITLLLFNPLLFAQANEIPAPEYISTIQFKGSTSQSQLPIIRLGERLRLSFDALNGNEDDFYYKITHHNFDWTESDLSKGEYLVGFDDVRIETYENSLNTLQIFSHYFLDIPNRETRAINKSGNYLISIYDDDGMIVFSRKFMVIENLVGVAAEVRRSRDLNFIREKQSVNFSINSPTLTLINPKQTVNVLVMQNSNLKTAITDLKPQYTIGSELIYRYDKESSFWGGNEFLNFDNKDVRAASNGVRKVDLRDLYENYLFTDITRADRPYTFNPDINGNFVVRNINAPDPTIEAEYVVIHFGLQYYEDIGDKEIHIYGNFNNWTIDGSTYMRYDEPSDTYRLSRLFKQGFYNYKYVLVDRDGSVDEGAISGNFWQTENDYTILVYYRELGGRFDRIIGMGMTNSTNITNN